MTTKALFHQKICQALGEATMCWRPMPTGTLDTAKASSIAAKLTDELLAIVQAPQPADDRKWIEIPCPTYGVTFKCGLCRIMWPAMDGRECPRCGSEVPQL